MNSTTLRRLAADHSSLHSSPLPPHYFFPPCSGISDDLTQLIILLSGPQGTPYASGLWKLHLKIPEDYPKNPPKAAFKTRIWHPNVEEVSGAVCVDTLKRDWDTKLTLRDVLITISCLLIHPNPDSALNSSAGALLQEDFSAFSRQAALMTSIHARIPPNLASAVQAAQQRGEDPCSTIATSTTTEQQPFMPRKPASTSNIITKKPVPLHLNPSDPSRSVSVPTPRPTEDTDSEPENDENAENDPSLSPSPVTIPILSPRRPTLAKRPLSDLPTPTELDSGDEEGLSPSERNIAANAAFLPEQSKQETMKLAERSRAVNFVSPGRNSWHQEALLASGVVPDNQQILDEEERPKKRVCSVEGKENAGEAGDLLGLSPQKSVSMDAPTAPKATVGGTVRKASAHAGAAAAKARGRTGLRRL